MPSDGRTVIKVCPYAKNPGSAASKHPMRTDSASLLQGARAVAWHVPATSRYRTELADALTGVWDDSVSTWDVTKFGAVLLRCQRPQCNRRLVGSFPDQNGIAGETWKITPDPSAVPPEQYTPAPLRRRRP